MRIVESNLGPNMAVPTGLRGKCDGCGRNFVTEGGEIGDAWEGEDFNGKFSYMTGFVVYIIGCNCGSLIEFDSAVPVRP